MAEIRRVWVRFVIFGAWVRFAKLAFIALSRVRSATARTMMLPDKHRHPAMLMLFNVPSHLFMGRSIAECECRRQQMFALCSKRLAPAPCVRHLQNRAYNLPSLRPIEKMTRAADGGGAGHADGSRH
jgi:hypothetical protein